MRRGYRRGQRRTVAILARQYSDGRFALDESEIDSVVDHSERFFVLLPVRMRLVVALILRVFSMLGRLMRPFGRSLAGMSADQQKRVYNAWCSGRGYFAYLRRQMIHMTFVGSLYSHSSVQKAIGYVKVRELKQSLSGEEAR